jgi:hypothetical protein
MSRPISAEAEAFGDLLSAVGSEGYQFTGEVAVNLDLAEAWDEVPPAVMGQVAARLRHAEHLGLVVNASDGVTQAIWRRA